MTRTIKTTSFGAFDGNESRNFAVTGLLTPGKAKKYAAKQFGVETNKVTLTSPLAITEDVYEMADEVFVQYATVITKERA